jgi:hypothetical protein
MNGTAGSEWDIVDAPMRGRVAWFHRSAVIWLPALFLASCVVSLLILGLSGGLPRACHLAWDFGNRRVPHLAYVGLCLGVLDYAFTSKTKPIFITAVFLAIAASFLGWGVARFIVH